MNKVWYNYGLNNNIEMNSSKNESYSEKGILFQNFTVAYR